MEIEEKSGGSIQTVGVCFRDIDGSALRLCGGERQRGRKTPGADCVRGGFFVFKSVFASVNVEALK